MLVLHHGSLCEAHELFDGGATKSRRSGGRCREGERIHRRESGIERVHLLRRLDRNKDVGR